MKEILLISRYYFFCLRLYTYNEELADQTQPEIGPSPSPERFRRCDEEGNLLFFSYLSTGSSICHTIPTIIALTNSHSLTSDYYELTLIAEDEDDNDCNNDDWPYGRVKDCCLGLGCSNIWYPEFPLCSSCG